LREIHRILGGMKAKTPEELGQEESEYQKYSLYLQAKNVAYLKKRADKANVSLSKVIDEAIVAYIDMIKDKKND
jgi:spore coat polysaccharide biosynthesis predicted glycosyltransferase SpsG